MATLFMLREYFSPSLGRCRRVATALQPGRAHRGRPRRHNSRRGRFERRGHGFQRRADRGHLGSELCGGLMHEAGRGGRLPLMGYCLLGTCDEAAAARHGRGASAFGGGPSRSSRGIDGRPRRQIDHGTAGRSGSNLAATRERSVSCIGSVRLVAISARAGLGRLRRFSFLSAAGPAFCVTCGERHIILANAALTVGLAHGWRPAGALEDGEQIPLIARSWSASPFAPSGADFV
jgi:hypothetical protein